MKFITIQIHYAEQETAENDIVVFHVNNDTYTCDLRNQLRTAYRAELEANPNCSRLEAMDKAISRTASEFGGTFEYMECSLASVLIVD